MRHGLVLLVVLVVVAVLAAPTAMARLVGNKTGQTCYKGLYVNYIDTSTGKPFTTENACTSSLARTGVLYPVSTTGICWDTSWALIEDQNNGADGSSTSGIACANFVLGGGSLAGVQTNATGAGTAFVSYTVNAFAVNDVLERDGKELCFFDVAPFCFPTSSDEESGITAPYTFTETGSLACATSTEILYDQEIKAWFFSTLGSHFLSTVVFCVAGTRTS
jgi:hypothetical protein